MILRETALEDEGAQRHRTREQQGFEKTSGYCLVQDPLSEQGQLQQTAQDLVSSQVLNVSRSGASTISLGQSLPVLVHLHSKG